MFKIWPRAFVSGISFKPATCEMKSNCQVSADYIAEKLDGTRAFYSCEKHAAPYMGEEK